MHIDSPIGSKRKLRLDCRCANLGVLFSGHTPFAGQQPLSRYIRICAYFFQNIIRRLALTCANDILYNGWRYAYLLGKCSLIACVQTIYNFSKSTVDASVLFHIRKSVKMFAKYFDYSHLRIIFALS